jgi:hypothetical protein
MYPETIQKQLDAANCYADILNEAHVRIQIINALVTNGLGLPPPIVREFCFLELRMLCELIALGCLVAHGGISAVAAAKIEKEYAADRIMHQLEGLHLNFYPHAVSMTFNPGHMHFDRVESGFLTRQELKELYRKCGDALHRGTLKKLKLWNDKTDPNYQDIIGWTRRIINLLEQHHIASFDNLSHFICVLSSADHENRAIVSIAQSPLPH